MLKVYLKTQGAHEDDWDFIPANQRNTSIFLLLLVSTTTVSVFGVGAPDILHSRNFPVDG